MSHNSTLRSDPEKLKARQQRSRQHAADQRHARTVATGKSFHGKRRGIRHRRPSKKYSVDGDSSRVIKDEMDQLVRDVIALRDDQCFTCPATEGLEVGHLFRRGIEITRWSLANNCAQCNPCNSRHEYEPEHYIGAYVQRYGEQAYNELRTISQGNHKFGYTELLDLRDSLRSELEKLKDVNG